MEQSGKKNAKRYLVIAQDGKSATVWAENIDDVLKELDESQQVDTPSFVGTPLGLVHWKRASSPVEAGTAGYL